MSKVRSRGNVSTELAVESVLKVNNITGWRKHPREIIGRPDFYFPVLKLVIFVDGCFWHSCSKCGRIPKSRTKFWTNKIANNCRRDKRIRRQLRKTGFAVMRIWEHELARANENRLANRIKRFLHSNNFRLISSERKNRDNQSIEHRGCCQRRAKPQLAL